MSETWRAIIMQSSFAQVLAKNCRSTNSLILGVVGDTTRSELTGAQGVTLLKLRVLENGKVGEGHIKRSAGHADLDNAAMDAVKKWLFQPARMGTIPVAVWVLLPVKFEIQ